MDKKMKSMEWMPGALRMKMYSRDDLKNMQNIGDENAAESDADDDNNEPDLPARPVFLTPTHLAIAMEYAAGGELFGKMCNAGRFSEDEYDGKYQSSERHQMSKSPTLQNGLGAITSWLDYTGGRFGNALEMLIVSC